MIMAATADDEGSLSEMIESLLGEPWRRWSAPSLRVSRVGEGATRRRMSCPTRNPIDCMPSRSSRSVEDHVSCCHRSADALNCWRWPAVRHASTMRMPLAPTTLPQAIFYVLQCRRIATVAYLTLPSLSSSSGGRRHRFRHCMLSLACRLTALNAKMMVPHRSTSSIHSSD